MEPPFSPEHFEVVKRAICPARIAPGCEENLAGASLFEIRLPSLGNRDPKDKRAKAGRRLYFVYLARQSTEGRFLPFFSSRKIFQIFGELAGHDTKGVMM